MGGIGQNQGEPPTIQTSNENRTCDDCGTWKGQFETENLEQHFETGRTKGKGQMMGLEYAVVIEKAPGNYCAYVPDLPGCVATGKTREETYRQISEAIALHLEGLKEDGLPIPEPQSSTALVKV